MAVLRQLLPHYLLPRLSTPTITLSPLGTPRAPLLAQRLTLLNLLAPLSIPSATSLDIPSILAGLWESVLRAVPKKKTSHKKKRQRFLAGKALQDVTALNKCSACGNVKRSHLLCPFCVNGSFRGLFGAHHFEANQCYRNSGYVGRKDRFSKACLEGVVKNWTLETHLGTCSQHSVGMERRLEFEKEASQRPFE